MKRTKKLYVLLGVLLVVCAVTFGVSKFEQKKEVIKNSDEIILKIASEDVQSLSWKNETDEFAFHKDEKWIYDADEAFPVDAEKIDDMLEQFEEFGVSFIIEDVEDYSQYGLDKPICTINLKANEETYEISLGDFSKMDSERYVSIGDGNAYLVKHDPLDEFDATLKDVIDHDETPDFDKVNEVQFAGAENYQITYEEDSANTYCEEDVYFTKQNDATLPLDTSLVDGYLDSVSWLDPTDYVTYNATDDDLKTYGLDNPELSVTVQYTNKDDDDKEVDGTFVLNIARDPEEKAKAEKEANKDKSDKNEMEDTSEEEITAYVRVGESKIIYKILGTDYTDLMKASYNDLRHQEVFSGKFNDINQIDISLEDVDYTITSEGKDDKRTWHYQDEELDVADLKLALSTLKVDSFTDESPTQKKEIDLTVHLDNENFPEVKIELYRYDGTSCLAVVDGTPVALVSRASVVELIEAVNAIVLK